jgi:iron-sulfur cluster repair protein YtfE (RIC family)
MGLEAGPAEFFTQDHRDCDELWAAVEQAVDSGGDSAVAYGKFEGSLLQHLAMEEEVLFPALEQASGTQGGPTMIMRAEHRQMRGLLEQMRAAAESGDFETVVDQGDTLLMLIQQHNMKEESVLYPLAQRLLASSWPQLSQQLAPYLEH